MRIQSSPFYLETTQQPDCASKADVVRLAGHAREENTFNEDWLQNLIHQNPALLPASDIEPALDQLIPVCRELPCPCGFLDNLYVTPNGYLVLVECKLWRNPESRRKVVAQIMDYAKDFAAWDYDNLMQAINKANKTTHENPLYEIAQNHPDTPDEITFVDRVTRNLATGRHLLMIVGDGIQENVESLTQYIQKYMGLHFSLALVEIGLYHFPEQSGLLVIPNIIAQTTNIERAVIRMENVQASIHEPIAEVKASTSQKATTLSETEFFEKLAEKIPGGAQWLKKVLPELEKMGVTYEVRRSLILRYSPDGENSFSLGYFEKSGLFQTAQSTWYPHDLGHIDIAYTYLREMANIVQGGAVKENNKPTEWLVMANGRTLSIADLLGKENEFLPVVSHFVENIQKLVRQS